MNNKQFIWCEITIENYKVTYPLLKKNNLCPFCLKNNIECFFYNHKKNIKYFYSYPLNKEKKVNSYLYDDVTNVLYLVDDLS